MKLIPVLTEKSLAQAKLGSYTFFAEPKYTKGQLKAGINMAFGVHVADIKTINLKREEKKGAMGRKKIVPARKKVIVSLKKDEKIDLFETKEDKKK